MKYYLTTPIYYVNATPHVGHAYTTIVADVVKRFRRMLGYEAFLCTGTDEHGQNVERAARKAGWSAKEFADRVSAAFRRQWDELGIDYDVFIRTTEPRHHRTVQWLFERCRERGYVYKGHYTGQYCVNCELYVSDAEAGAPCPDCGRPTETVTEENYFFKLSAFQDKLLQLYEQDPRFVQPDARRNEVISFVRGGLKDLSISRSNLKWGIPLPDDSGHVFYVWFDALTNYLSAIGYGAADERERARQDLWPADLHLVGKEIVRFHAVYWPAFLMAADLPLPKRIYAHGWLIFQGDKMSKSKGNIVRATPIDKVVGIEGLRYYLLREIVFGQDGNFSLDAVVERYNSDLANGLGNLSSRTLAMIHRYFEGKVPAPAETDKELAALAQKTIHETRDYFSDFEFSRGLETIWSLMAAADKYIVEQKPWVLAKNKDPESQEKLRATLYNSAEIVRIVAALACPVLPKSAANIWRQLGQEGSLADLRLDGLQWGQLKPGTPLGQTSAVFPRLEVEEAVKKMNELEAQALKEQAEIMGKKQAAAAPAPSGAQPPEEGRESAAQESPKISIEDFAKVEMRVGEVKSAERVKKAGRLLHLMVDIGEAEPRSIVAGIAEAYEPESLIGRKVIIVSNLQPRKLRGLESNGMIVAATGENGKPALVGLHEDAPIGARLS